MTISNFTDIQGMLSTKPETMVMKTAYEAIESTLSESALSINPDRQPARASRSRKVSSLFKRQIRGGILFIKLHNLLLLD